MASLLQPLLNLLQLRHHPFASRLPPEGKIALPVPAAGMRKAQEVERLRLPFSLPLPGAFGPATELDQLCLVRVQFQPEFCQAFLKLLLESLSVFPGNSTTTSISRSIIEAHGGRLWAENGPEGGGDIQRGVTTFGRAIESQFESKWAPRL